MTIRTFDNGIHPEYNKSLTSACAVESLPISKQLIIPLQQHIGQTAKALVAKGDLVEEGQIIAEAAGFVSAPVHASASGKVKEIEYYSHPAGIKILSIVIKTDGEVKEWPSDEEGNVGIDLAKYSQDEIRAKVKAAGIVGMGGAAFPTVVKLSPPKEKVINSVILNGCECEPFLTADHRIMLEQSEKVIHGLKIIMKSVGATKGYVGIEDNKADAKAVMEKAIASIDPSIEIIDHETKYPQGAEKMLIKTIMGKEVPIGKLPMDLGVVVQNVATACAVYDAVKFDKPLLERVVTVSGNGIKEPKNLLVRVGTSFKDVIAHCGGLVEGGEKEVLNGGPMMGIAQTNMEVPVVKGTSGITVLEARKIKPVSYDPCIRCGECVEVCPMALTPLKIADMGRLAMTDPFNDWQGMSCIECGCCAFVCPSKRPLVEWIRVGKNLLREEHRKAAEQAEAG